MGFTNEDIMKVYPHFRNYAFYLTENNSNEAEDLLHDAILMIFEKRDLYKNNSKLEKWGCAIMHNLYIDKIRLKSRNKQVYLSDIKDINFAYTSDDISKIAEMHARYKEIKSKLKDVKSNLYLSVFIMRDMGLKMSEISDIMHIPITTVKTRLHLMKNHILSQSKISSHGRKIRNFRSH
jgi:RNA polymerase sigma-70 factor (ECF subfamily)